jgi:hypothetical protein
VSVERLLAAMLRLFPADFRAGYEEMMRATLAERAREARARGVLALASATKTAWYRRERVRTPRGAASQGRG